MDILKAGNLCFGFLNVQSASVVRVKLAQLATLLVALGEVLVVIEGAVVGRYTVEVAHINCLGALLVGQQGLIHLLTMPDADDLDVFLLTTEELANGFGLSLDGAGRSLLNEDVTILAMLEGEEDEVNGFFERHDEAGHLGFGEGDRVAVADLVNPERNYGTA